MSDATSAALSRIRMRLTSTQVLASNFAPMCTRAVVVLSALLLASCFRSQPDGDAGFWQACSTTSECERGYDCVCGRCTQGCVEFEHCAQLARSGADCRPAFDVLACDVQALICAPTGSETSSNPWARKWPCPRQDARRRSLRAMAVREVGSTRQLPTRAHNRILALIECTPRPARINRRRKTTSMTSNGAEHDRARMGASSTLRLG